MLEEWETIPEYRGLYEASTLGRVRSLDRVTSHGHRLKGQILKQHLCSGYPSVNLYNGEFKNKKHQVHRLVANTFIPNIYELPTVNHINGIKTDNTVLNLEWLSHGDNHRHAYSTGLRDSNSESLSKNRELWREKWMKPVVLHRDTCVIECESLTEAAEFLGVNLTSLTYHTKTKGDSFTYRGWEVVVLR